MARQQYVYILASRRNGTLYTGMTNDLRRRLEQHRGGWSDFTRRYGVRTLVYFEVHDDRLIARQRERNIKEWKRAWKLSLIESVNPDWLDLSGDIPLD